MTGFRKDEAYQATPLLFFLLSVCRGGSAPSFSVPVRICLLSDPFDIGAFASSWSSFICPGNWFATSAGSEEPIKLSGWLSRRLSEGANVATAAIVRTKTYLECFTDIFRGVHYVVASSEWFTLNKYRDT